MDDALRAIPKKRRAKKVAPPGPVRKALAAAWPWLGRGALWALPFVAAVAGLGVFERKYYRENAVFEVRPEAIIVRGNSTVTRDFLLQTFGLSKPRNGFDLLESDIVERLRRQMPVLKQVQMTYTPGRTLELWVEERTPLARLPGEFPPLLVDDEGAVFRYQRKTDGYPVLSGFDLPDLLEPGARLPEGLHCMLRLIAAANRPEYRLPSSIRRVSLLGTEPEDGLRVTLADGRRVDVAWEGMGREREPSEGMLRRLRNVGTVLRSPVNAGKRHFNAMAKDFVAVSE